MHSISDWQYIPILRKVFHVDPIKNAESTVAWVLKGQDLIFPHGFHQFTVGCHPGSTPRPYTLLLFPGEQY